MKRLMNVVVVLGALLALMAAPASAAILAEDFDGMATGTDLWTSGGGGQTLQTGQQWAQFDFYESLPTLWVDPDFSSDLSTGQGGGGKGSSHRGNTVSVGQTLSSGVITFSIDMRRNNSTVWGTQYWLSNTDRGNNQSASLQWWKTNGVLWEGLGLGDSFHSVPSEATVLRTILTIDLDTKAVSYSFFDLLNDPTGASAVNVSMGNYAGGFDLAELHLKVISGGSTSNGGFDNIVLTPEPATLAVLSLGALASLVRRRRR